MTGGEPDFEQNKHWFFIFLSASAPDNNKTFVKSIYNFVILLLFQLSQSDRMGQGFIEACNVQYSGQCLVGIKSLFDAEI